MLAKENKFNNDDDDETDATSTDSSDTKSSLNNEDEDAGLHDDYDYDDDLIDEFYFDDEQDMQGHPIYNSVGKQVISKPLSGKGRTSPRAVFGTASRFGNSNNNKASQRRKVNAIVVKKKFKNEKFFMQCYDESPGPQYLPVPSLWGLKNNVGAKSKPERHVNGVTFDKSPRFNI